MDIELMNNGKLKEMFPEIYSEFIPGRYYQYKYGGIAYFRGITVDISGSKSVLPTFGVNSSGDIVVNTRAWFIIDSDRSMRGFNNYKLASYDSIKENFKGAVDKKGFNKGTIVKYAGKLYQLNGVVTVLEDNVSIGAVLIGDLGTHINIPFILGGKLASSLIRLV